MDIINRALASALIVHNGLIGYKSGDKENKIIIRMLIKTLNLITSKDNLNIMKYI